jgi:hypothetical protein
MVDKFATYSSGLDSPASDVFPITPNDGTDLAVATRAIRADTGGVVVLVTMSGNERTCKFADGETRAIRATRVKATGTTATGLEGMA